MCLVWNFKRANIASIKSAIYVVLVKFLLSNKSVLEQVSIFNKRLMIFFPIIFQTNLQPFMAKVINLKQQNFY